MKILQINNVYGEKSTGKITKDLHEGLLREGCESIVVYGRGKTVKAPYVVRLCPDWYGKWNSFMSRLTGVRYGGCLLSTCLLQCFIFGKKPDVVHLQCVNGNFVNIFRLVRWLKERQIKTVVTLHAEFMYTANCGHAFDCEQWKHGCKACPDKKKMTKSLLFDRTGSAWNMMKDAFCGFENHCVICPVSPWTESRAMQSDIMKTFRFEVVYNGIDTEHVFCFRPEAMKRDRTVLHVTAAFSDQENHPKGGWYLLRLAERMPDVTFLVAGKAAANMSVPENVVLLGEIRDQNQLAQLYREVNLSLLVSKRETFSMPCAESLCCGTPVVGFRAGAPEQIALPDYSSFVDFGDLDGMELAVRYWLDKDNVEKAQIASEAERTYSSRTMIQRYLRIYGSL